VRAEDVFLASVPGAAELEGRSLASFVDELDLPAEEAAKRLIDRHGQGIVIVLFSMDEADVRRVLVHPTTMIGTDGLDNGSKPHPRAFGTYPRILGHYVREQGLLTLEAAIHKMTGMPAAKFDLPGRGVIREGSIADLVLFDPATVADRATYAEPRVPPAGMPWVLVNGTAVVREGVHTHARAGRTVRRGSV
jgi:N-acyl-D-amino-acid deacylase